jgi:hypothetical protein
VPEIDAGVTGVGGSATVKIKFGGSNVGHSVKAFGDAAQILAVFAKDRADMLMNQGKFQERQKKYELEKQLAQDELNQIDSTRTAIATLKVAIAQSHLDDHDLKIQNAQDVASFLQTKFTNQQLYSWMVGQIAGTYFQSYQLAYQMAKRAEAAYNLDIGNYDGGYASFLQPSYWDNLHQGLLAAEPLTLDLERMQSSFVDNYRKEYEITRVISLSALDPTLLGKLAAGGTAVFSLPESFFDGDYAGHYMRRIKYAGLIFKFPSTVTTRPTTINCTLTLTGSQIRTSADRAKPLYTVPITSPPSMVTSNGGTPGSGGTFAADNGMFETTIHYIITDDRYLAFELQGAISSWQIDLLAATNPGMPAPSDILLQMEYTARS